MSVRRIEIRGQFIDSFLRDSELWQSSLPKDVHVVGVSEDRDSQTFVLLVESNEFPAVGEGQLVPFIDAVFTRK